MTSSKKPKAPSIHNGSGMVVVVVDDDDDDDDDDGI